MYWRVSMLRRKHVISIVRIISRHFTETLEPLWVWEKEESALYTICFLVLYNYRQSCAHHLQSHLPCFWYWVMLRIECLVPAYTEDRNGWLLNDFHALTKSGEATAIMISAEAHRVILCDNSKISLAQPSFNQQSWLFITLSWCRKCFLFPAISWSKLI